MKSTAWPHHECMKLVGRLIAICVALAMVVVVLDPKPAQAASAGNGSLALGVAGGAEAIDPHTGDLHFGVPLGTLPGIGAANVDLNLTYDQATPADTGLSPGLSWGLPSVVDAGETFTSGGRSFPVAPAASSGLLGYLLQDAAFKVHQPALGAGTTGCAAARPCAYTMSYADGRIDAFDASGLLASRTDRDANTSQYTWDGAHRLSSISGGFPDQPQKVTVTYTGSNQVSVQFPKRSDNVTPVATLQMSNGQLYQLTDTSGNQTMFSWVSQNANGVTTWLMSGWRTSAGANITATYKSYPGGVWAVETLSTQDAHTEQPLSPTVTVSLDPAGTGKNYTGNPNHLGPAPANSGTTDALVASNDRSYTYATSIDDGVTTTLRTYNALHQMISLTNTQTVAGRDVALSSTTLAYPEPTALWPSVSPNYQVPISTTTKITDPTTGTSRTVTTTAAYDALGRQVSQTVNGVRTDTCYDSGQVEPLVAAASGCPAPASGRGFAQVLQVTSTVVSGSDTGAVQQQSTTLTGDRAHPATVTGSASDPAGAGPLSTVSQTGQTWDSNGQVLSTTTTAFAADGTKQSQSRSLTYSVADGMRVVQLTDEAGGVSRSVADPASGLLTQQTSTDGTQVSHGYDPGGRLTSTTTGSGTVTYAYTTAGFNENGTNATLSTRAADGYQVRTVHDAVGRDLSTSDNQSNGQVGTSWRQLNATGYDPRGNVSSRTDQAGLVTSYAFSATTGLMSQLTMPDGQLAKFTYDAGAGSVTATTSDTAGKAVATLTRVVDNLNRPVQQTSTFADNTPGRVVGTAYTGFGEVSALNDSQTTTTGTFTRDAFNHLTSVTQNGQDATATATYGTSPSGSPATVSLQLAGAVSQGSASAPQTAFDAIGRKSTRTDQTGQSEHITYDDASRPSQVTHPDGRVQHTSYDPITGQQAQTWWTLPSDPTTPVDGRSYSYDPVTAKVQAVWYTAAKNTTTVSYAYYPDGMLKSVTYPDGRSLRYVYTDKGQLQQVTDPLGASTAYAYDPDSGRLNSATQAALETAYTYDTRGNVQSVTRSNNGAVVGQTTYTWDGAAHLLSSTSTGAAGSSETRTYTWDSSDRVQSEHVVIGDQVPVPTSGPLAGQRDTTTTYTYDSLNRLSAEKITAPGAGSTPTTLSQTTYTPGPGSSLQSMTVSTPGGTSTTAYGTDAAGRQTSITVDGQTQKIDWDALGHQTSDAAGNTYGYTTDGQLQSWTPSNGETTTLTWRADGSLETQTDPDDSTTTTYQLPGDTAQVLAQATTAGGTTTATSSLLGRAREATITTSGTLTDPQPCTPKPRKPCTPKPCKPHAQKPCKPKPCKPHASKHCTPKPCKPHASKHCTPKPCKPHAEKPCKPGRPGLGQSPTSASWLQTSHRGDVTTVLNATGTAVQHTSYTAYGTPTTQLSGQATASNFGHTGALTFDTGLVHLNARQYDPTNGTFTSKDTIDAVNLYLYGQANPVMYTDPTGHMPTWTHDLLHWGGVALTVVGIIADIAGMVMGGISVIGVIAGIVNIASVVLSETAANDKKLNTTTRNALFWTGFAAGVVGAVAGGAEGATGYLAKSNAADAAAAAAAPTEWGDAAGHLDIESVLTVKTPEPPKGPVDPDTVDFNIPADKHVFWSGRTDITTTTGTDTYGSGGIAAGLARQHGATTLEMYLADNNIAMPVWGVDAGADVAWGDVSRRFADAASGDVHVVLGQTMRPGNIWETREIGALQANPAVTRIIAIDPATGTMKTIFQR